MIKVHGAELDAQFYGQAGDSYPELLTSPSLAREDPPGNRGRRDVLLRRRALRSGGPGGGRARRPADPDGLPAPGRLRLRRLDHDRLGRRRRDDVRRLDRHRVPEERPRRRLARPRLARGQAGLRQLDPEAGAQPDLAEEKTCCSSCCSAIRRSTRWRRRSSGRIRHAGVGAAVAAGGAALAARRRRVAGAAAERSARRAYRLDLGAALRGALPSAGACGDRQAAARGAARRGAADAERVAGSPRRRRRRPPRAAPPGEGPRRRLAGEAAKPTSASTSRTRSSSASPPSPRGRRVGGALAPRASRGHAAIRRSRRRGPARKLLEYYWSARRRVGPVAEVRLLQVVADEEGNVLRSRMVVSS